VRLIKNVPVPADAIEVLTSEGWWPLVKLDAGALKSMMPAMKDLGWK